MRKIVLTSHMSEPHYISARVVKQVLQLACLPIFDLSEARRIATAMLSGTATREDIDRFDPRTMAFSLPAALSTNDPRRCVTGAWTPCEIKALFGQLQQRLAKPGV